MKLSVKEIAIVAIFPAMMGATAGISIPVGSAAPITLQTMFVFLAGLLLGPKLGALSMVIYVVMGAIGIPVFSNFNGGIAVLLSLRGGFIIGFVFSALFIGFMKNINFLNKNYAYIFAVLVGGNVIIYMFGASYMSYLGNSSLATNLALFTSYYIGDFIKIVVVLYVYKRLHSQITYERS